MDERALFTRGLVSMATYVGLFSDISKCRSGKSVKLLVFFLTEVSQQMIVIS